jgi:hypothetical protein
MSLDPNAASGAFRYSVRAVNGPSRSAWSRWMSITLD